MDTICTNARAVARYIISRQREPGMNTYELTNMRLQKLLYFAQGFVLGRNGKPLFADPFHALPYGPVCLDIYGMLKQYANDTIPISAGEQNLESLDPAFDVRDYLDIVMRWANNYTTWQLVGKSHVEGGPWARIWVPGTIWYREIPLTLIASYFGKFFNN